MFIKKRIFFIKKLAILLLVFLFLAQNVNLVLASEETTINSTPVVVEISGSEAANASNVSSANAQTEGISAADLLTTDNPDTLDVPVNTTDATDITTNTSSESQPTPSADLNGALSMTTTYDDVPGGYIYDEARKPVSNNYM